MPQPRKHHYLPQFYLRGFSSDRRTIFQIEKATGKHYRAQIKDTAAIRDFHEIDNGSAEDSYSLEKSLALYESELSEALQLFLAEGISHSIALSKVIRLLSMLRMRVPAIKQYIDQSLSSNIRAAAKMMESSGKLPKPPSGLEEPLRIDNLEISITNWKCLELMFSLADDSDLLNVFDHMRATLYRCQPNQFFVTSDQPVALYHPTLRSSSPYGVGPALRGVEITLPLTAFSLLKLDHEQGQHREIVASPDEVKELNRRTIIMAQNYIFTKEQPQTVSDQAIQWQHIFAGFRFDDLAVGGQLFQIHRSVPVSPPEMENTV